MIDFHIRGNNILDLFFSNRPDLVNQCSPMPGISDHHAVFVETNMCALLLRPPKHKYACGVKQKECSSLSDTILNLADTNIEDCWILFKHVCTLIGGASKTDITEIQPTLGNQRRQAYHTTEETLIFKRARRSNTQHDWDRYKTIKRQAQLTCRRAYDHHVASMLSEDHENP